MQLSQRSDDSPKDADDQDREYRPLVSESPTPLVHPTYLSTGIPPEATAATPSGLVPAPSRAFPVLLVSHKAQTAADSTNMMLNRGLADVTPRLRAPRQPSVFVPATPSQNKILHKDVPGSGDTDLSELSGDSGTDSMKALSRKVAARTDSLIAITKRASILADFDSFAGAPGNKAVKRRVLDSEDEQVLSSSRKDAKGGSRPGVSDAKKALPTVVDSVVEDDMPPAPTPLKSKTSRIFLKLIVRLFVEKEGRPKSTKNPGPPDEKPKQLVSGKATPKRKREDKDDDAEVGGVFDVQQNPPPVKRARKTAGGKPGTTKRKAISPAPPPSPLRDSQVLKKARPAAKKNANYGGRTKAARISPSTRNSATLSGGDDSPGALDFQIRPVDPRVEPPLMDADDDRASSPPALPKPKPKSKAVAKPKSTLAETSIAQEKLKATTMKAKAKNRTGARARGAATKAKDADDEKIVKVGPPRRAKGKAKRKLEVLSADEWEDEKGEEEREKFELTKDSQAVIEVSSSPLEPPKVIPPKRKPDSRVTSQEVVFNSSRCIHASLIVALIVHARNVLQVTYPMPRNRQRTDLH